MQWTAPVAYLAVFVAVLVAFGGALSFGGLLATAFVLPVAVVFGFVAVVVAAMVVLGRGEGGSTDTPYW